MPEVLGSGAAQREYSHRATGRGPRSHASKRRRRGHVGMPAGGTPVIGGMAAREVREA